MADQITTTDNVDALMLDMGRRARAAARPLAFANTKAKDKALLAMADAIDDAKADILAANALDLQTVRAVPGGDGFTHRVLQRGNGANAFGNSGKAGFIQQQAVEERAGNAIGFGALHVERVGGENAVLCCIDGVGHGEQRLVLGGGVGEGERTGGGAGAAADVQHQGPDVDRGVSHWPSSFPSSFRGSGRPHGS